MEKYSIKIERITVPRLKIKSFLKNKDACEKYLEIESFIGKCRYIHVLKIRSEAQNLYDIEKCTTATEIAIQEREYKRDYEYFCGLCYACEFLMSNPKIIKVCDFKHKKNNYRIILI